MGYKRILEGIVTQAGTMQKTIIVSVDRVKMHQVYHKRIRTQRKYKVHDEKNQARIGDRVRIIETRHISKDKYFMLMDIVQAQAKKEEVPC